MMDPVRDGDRGDHGGLISRSKAGSTPAPATKLDAAARLARVMQKYGVRADQVSEAARAALREVN